MLDTYFDVHTGDIDIPSPPPINFTTQQAAILTYLQSQGSLPLDAIATYLDIAPSALLADITLLEMSTCIREERPGQYIVV
jgi:predicted ArsR family transcriptional regulator